MSKTIEYIAAEYAETMHPDANATDAPYCTTGDRYEEVKAAYIAGATEADKRAMEFAEWCEANYFQKAKGVWVADIDSGGEHYNTQYLLTIFNNRK